MFKSEIRREEMKDLDHQPGVENAKPLNTMRTGQWVRVYSIPHRGSLRAQFIRVGIHEGEKIRCLERLPGGTVVIQKNRQQVAIGHQLAHEIYVVAIAGDGKAK